MIIDWASGANAQLLAYQWPIWNWSTGEGGAAPEPEPEAQQTYSGGWSRALRDESETERKARIHAERVKLGIIEPAPEKPAAFESPGATIEARAATLLLPPEAAGFDPALYDALALDLATLHTGAYLDELIRRNFQILDDEEDAAVLMLALAVLH